MRRSVRYCNIPLSEDKQKEPLKLRPCPNPECRRVGCLIGHGHLCGYGEGNKRVIRGDRVYCSDRRRGPKGCGKTFSILPGALLSRRQVNAPQLFEFFEGMLRGLSRRAAWRALGVIYSIRHAYRLWRAFLDHQLRIRELLCRLLAPPPVGALCAPALQLVQHLQAAFASVPCPISAFQAWFQEGFLG
jgi:hypothetical protein